MKVEVIEGIIVEIDDEKITLLTGELGTDREEYPYDIEDMGKEWVKHYSNAKVKATLMDGKIIKVDIC